MRLIDADKLIEVLHESLEGDCDLREDYEFMGIDEFIKNQPTAYDVDKVVEQIKMIAIPVLDEDEHIVPESNIHETCEIEMVALSNTIEIVKGGGMND